MFMAHFAGDWGKMEAGNLVHLKELYDNLTWLSHWGIYNNTREAACINALVR